MRLPVSWLREYVDLDLGVEELARALTIAGLEVTKHERTGEDWANVFVGEVVRVEPHPDADRLVLTTVDYGRGELTVVTGAPNVAAGRKVALALAGAMLWDAYAEAPRKRKLKPGTIRGVRSEGMVCSERELGLSAEHEGILVLPPDAPVGVPLASYLGEDILTLDLQPSFSYANSVIGIAREAAVITGGTFKGFPEASLPAGAPGAGVRVEGPHVGARYMLQRLDGLRIGPSSASIERRLRACGMRPINNVVDVTNYVMLEYGQPLHAFDVATVAGDVLVRAAPPGEEFETLDHQKRTMPRGTIMIADEEKAIGIGGIMGGLESEVGPETRSILLESATFEPRQIRRSSRAMGLRTEASARFERGLDPELAARALARAVELLREEADAEPAGAPADWYPAPARPAPVRLPYADVTRILGVPVAPDEIADILRSLEFAVEADGDGVTATPPSYRRDVTQTADLVEEIGRIHGYDAIPAVLPSGELPVQRTDEEALLERKAREWLAGAGMQEVINYDLTSARALQPLEGLARASGPALWRPADDMLRVLYPLSSDREYLRPSLLPGLLQNLAENLRHQERVWLFELDRVFVRQGDGLPDEPKRLGMALAGLRRPESPHLAEGCANLFDLKGVVEGLLRELNTREVRLTPVDGVPAGMRNALGLEIEGRCAGYLLEPGPEMLAASDIDLEIAVCELDWGTILSASGRVRRFEPFSRFPAVLQDLAVGVPEAVAAGAVEQLIHRHGGRFLREVRLREVYRGAPLPPGSRSLLYRLSFQADDRTLTEQDATKYRKSIAWALREQLGAEIRGMDEE